VQESEQSDNNINIKVEVNTDNQGYEEPSMVEEMEDHDWRYRNYPH
jgi:hypothetical protein